MALTNCPECSKEVSNQAETCPHCGHPLRPVVIERTSKRWKVATLVSWVVLLGGASMFFNGYSHGGWDNSITGHLGFTLAFAGVASLVVARVGAWWNHD